MSRFWKKSYIGAGGTGRNTAIIRSNYLTPEGVRFYDRSVQLFEELSADLNLNLFYSQRGHFTLAHSDAALQTMRWRAEVNKHLGVDSEVVDRAFIRKRCPQMDLGLRTQHAGSGRPFSSPWSDRPPRCRGLGLRARRRPAGSRGFTRTQR